VSEPAASSVAASPAVVVRYQLGGGIGAACSTRFGGASAAPYDSLNLGLSVGDEAAVVAANRRALAIAVGLDADRLAWMRQAHTAKVRYVTADSGPPDGPVDAIVTNEAGLGLCVLAADCVPVLVADPHARLVGAAHAGREGLANGVVPALVEAMAEAGATPEMMRVQIGPSICGGCYEVPDELQARVAGVVPQSRCRTRSGMPGLDIATGIRAQLAAAGVGSVSSDARCTKESAELFSYRRDGTTGRFAGLIWLAP